MLRMGCCSLLINTQREKHSSVSVAEESPGERLLISGSIVERRDSFCSGHPCPWKDSLAFFLKRVSGIICRRKLLDFSL